MGTIAAARLPIPSRERGVCDRVAGRPEARERDGGKTFLEQRPELWREEERALVYACRALPRTSCPGCVSTIPPPRDRHGAGRGPRRVVKRSGSAWMGPVQPCVAKSVKGMRWCAVIKMIVKHS